MPASPTAPLPAPSAPSVVGKLASPDFAALYEAHAKAVYYLALRLLGDATQAEDAAHDVFVKAFRGLADFRREAEVRTWLYRITINHCQNLRRSWHQRNIRLAADGSFPEEPMSGDQETPLRLAESRDLGRQIQRSLDALPEEYRLLLLLIADEEMTYAQIAELTRQSCDSVRGKLYRARKAFATAFHQIS